MPELQQSIPWPLAVVQPGLVLLEGAVFKLAPARPAARGDALAHRPARAEWLVLIVPFCCFLMIGVLLGTAASLLAAGAGPILARAAGATVGLAFLLDPEAQHLATGGFTEMPFTLGLLAGLLLLVRGLAARRPLVFGVMLGLAGLFRGNMVWLLPVFALGAAATAPAGRRARAALLTVLGSALPLAPWWAYKWRTFGQPAWDLSLIAVWEGVEGRTWFSLTHRPELPVLPAGAAMWSALGGKFVGQFRSLLVTLDGPRALGAERWSRTSRCRGRGASSRSPASS